jgi:hypothetical protein
MANAGRASYIFDLRQLGTGGEAICESIGGGPLSAAMFPCTLTGTSPGVIPGLFLISIKATTQFPAVQ